jgi:hypothetical protein
MDTIHLIKREERENREKQGKKDLGDTLKI